jgi:PAS domain S-box-containing protein
LFVVHVDAAQPTVVYASTLLGELVGRPVQDIVGRPPWELVAAAQQAQVRDIIASRGPGAPPITLEFAIERPDGSQRDIEVGIARITTATAELAVCYFRDTTDERRAIEALRRSETRFRSLIENAPDGVVIVQDGRISLANPVAVKMFGVTSLDEVRGRLLSEFLPPEDAARAMERIKQICAGASPGSSEYRVLPTKLTVEVHSVPYEHEEKFAVLAFVRDVTERRRMLDQLFRTDRLAAMGTMAATVAHEVNNPLTYLRLSLQRLQLELETDPDPTRAAVLREHVKNALHGAQRVASIVDGLRTYTREQTAEPASPVDVVAIVERALERTDHDLRHRARLVRDYTRDPVIVDAVAGRLEQVVVNVLVNAIQSLDGSHPTNDLITVTIAKGREVTITITYTGAVNAEDEHVFDPFFTTSGLGLSVCKQLVESMRGQIELVRAVDKGTRVAIRLPVRMSQQPAESVREEDARGGRLRILLIDDDPLVRRAMAELLTEEHDVDDVGDGESALAMIAETVYDVIVCDLMMPGVTGRDIYERVLAQSPSLAARIVFVTGGAFVPTLARFLDSVQNLKLRKPFDRERVLAIVQQARRRS